MAAQDVDLRLASARLGAALRWQNAAEAAAAQQELRSIQLRQAILALRPGLSQQQRQTLADLLTAATIPAGGAS